MSTSLENTAPKKNEAAKNVSPKYATISTWRELTGQSRTSTYEALADGKLRAIKLGKRTLIDVEHGLAWLRSLPAAQIGKAA